MRGCIALLIGFFVLPTMATAADLFTASSKAQGAQFDLVVTETQRFSDKSYLDVPGFHDRTAPGSRWLICTYTALAVERGFSHWYVVYPPEGSNRLVVAFSNASTASPSQLLGPDYVKELGVGDGMVPVEKMAGFCGIKPK
jgi:hypothetical protein